MSGFNAISLRYTDEPSECGFPAPLGVHSEHPLYAADEDVPLGEEGLGGDFDFEHVGELDLSHAQDTTWSRSSGPNSRA